VHAAGRHAGRVAHGKEPVELAHDVVEPARLVSARVGERIGVHRVARPEHRVARHRDRAQHRRERVVDAVGAHAREEHEAARLTRGVQPLAQGDHVLRRGVGPELHSDRVPDTGQELHVRAVGLARALADPQQVCGAVVPVAGEAVAPCERFLVAEEQGLVRGPEVDLVQLQLRVQVDTARGHESHRPVDLVGEGLVPLALTTRRDELLVPRVHTREVGEPALRERAREVHRCCGLVVRATEAFGIGTARRGVEREVVHGVATERRQLEAVA
jgi:hypothetical protein